MTKLVRLEGRQRYSVQTGEQIVLWLGQGLSLREVGRRLNVPIATIRYWVKRHQLDLKAKGGEFPRPSPSQLAVLRQTLGLGATRLGAAAKAGMHPAAFEHWLEADPEFQLLVSKSEQSCEEKALRTIQRIAEEQWLPAAWLLERRFGYVKVPEVSLSEKQKLAQRIGTQLAASLALGLGEIGLSAEQQERMRKQLAQELEKAAQAI